ncbi:hypothetical protein MLD38_017418 [Melastoma candidum]|uniref:Uncharacterized protein n=1 Tax=Melastoma candidum TaxID=119954 RepID=A0ACB9QR44_9MYRT|nr:hypothetical protein MLD38_017418 [Melastoma candidum]
MPVAKDAAGLPKPKFLDPPEYKKGRGEFLPQERRRGLDLGREMARPEPTVSVSGSRGRRFVVPSTLLSLVLFLGLASISAVEGNNTDSKVEVAFYYETLCPYCSNFIVNGLNTELFTNGLISIVDLKLIPYGNARLGPNATITCQQADMTSFPSSLYSSPKMRGLPFFFLLLASSFANPCSAAGSESELVSLGFYYESLCPYSANFIVNYLGDVFHGDLLSIVDLNIVPWGNAKIRANDTFDCQHGPSECLLNTVEACAIDIWPDLNDHFPLIYCIEELVHERNYTQWESCFDKLGLDATAVSDCYTGGRGKELELGYAAETNALQPPHQYVPWVVVNGEPLYDDYENFVSYVCKAYSGTSLPEACSNSSMNPTSLMMNTKKASRVCHRTETTMTTAAI